MSAISRHVSTVTALFALLWASPTVARAGQSDSPAGMTVSLVRNGQAMPVKAMVLYAGSRPKGADLPAPNVGQFYGDDVDDRRRRGLLLVEKSADGTATVLIILSGVTPPALAPGATRQDLGPVEVYRGAQLVVDVGTGVVTGDARVDRRLAMRDFLASFGGGGGFSTMVPSLGFCDDNATRLGRINATQGACGLNGNSGAWSISTGVWPARVGGWGVGVVGGYGSFGETRPEATGSSSTFTVARRAQEVFGGGWVGLGLRRAWERWSLEPSVGVAFLRRKTETVDTFTRRADGLVAQNSVSQRDKDTQPVVSVEVLRRTGPFFIGTGYRFTQFTDAVKTQRLHGLYGTMKFTFGPGERRF
jgi:hypothetical protein